MTDMNFRNSCSYTCLSILLGKYSSIFLYIDDILIAKEINLPYYFTQHNGTYYAGGLLQGRKYFDLFLYQKLLCFNEENLNKIKVIELLKTNVNVMFGVSNGNRKHAVVSDGYDSAKDTFTIIWPEHKSIGGTRKESFNSSELINRLEDNVVVGKIIPMDSSNTREEMVDYVKNEIIGNMELTLQFLKSYENDLNLWKTRNIITNEIKYNLFRAFLVELPDMLGVVNEGELASEIKDLYGQLTPACESGDQGIKSSFINKILLLVSKYKSIVLNQMGSKKK